MLEFEWDNRKAEANWLKHRIDFMDAIDLFREPHLTYRSEYEPEPRFVSVGWIKGQAVAVVWTPRGENIRRVISARSARREERTRYRQSFPEGS